MELATKLDTNYWEFENVVDALREEAQVGSL
jgi:hypothetical protein